MSKSYCNFFASASRTIINVIFYYWSFPYNGIMGLANGTYTIYSGILMLIVPILAAYCGYIAGSKKFEFVEKIEEFMYEKEE